MANILMLTPQLPYPPHQGTSLRNLHMLRALAQSHQVSLLSFDEGDASPELEPLQSICRVLPPIRVPARSSMDRIRQLATSPLPDVAQRLRNPEFSDSLIRTLTTDSYEAIQVEGLELGPYIELVRQYAPQARIVLDCHNAETELQRRAMRIDLPNPSRWPVALYSGLQIGRLARFEKWAIQQADAILAVSLSDRAQLAKIGRVEEAHITIIPNTIDITEYEKRRLPAPDMAYDLVFTGKMDYRPNVDGVLWFARHVWPEIRRARPQTTWAIVGQRPHPRLDQLRSEAGITLTGRVPQIQPYLASASVCIMPLRIGSGTRLKLIEAMASSIPIVSTTLGAEGFDVAGGKELLLADTRQQWIDAVLQLLTDDGQRARLGEAASQFAAQYDWRRIIPLVSKLYDDLLDTDQR